MMVSWHVVFCALVHTRLILAGDKAREVCYPVVGCFNRDPPFDNAENTLPQSPSVLKSKFFLYTRENRAEEASLVYSSPLTVKNSPFKATRLTKVVIHGLSNSQKSSWIPKMREALLKQGDYNVIMVFWSEGARLLDYEHATANVRLVATELKVLIRLLERVKGLKLGDVHLIGHSLGAHVAGYTGTLLGSGVGRISGLDPADPNFQNLPWMVRLDPSDAAFVDVIHTDTTKFSLTSAVGFGTKQPSGHVDFFPNGGLEQPGCEDGVSGAVQGLFSAIGGGGSIKEKTGAGAACSHSRAHVLFLESINSECRFKAFPCESYEKFERGECYDCGVTGCPELGFHATDNLKARGSHYLTTFNTEPYCGSHYYQLHIQHAPSQSKTKGDFALRLRGRDGSESRQNSIMGKDYREIGHVDIRRPVVLDKSAAEIGGLKEMVFRYHRRKGLISFLSQASSTMHIIALEVKDVDTGKKYTFRKKNNAIITLKDRKDLRLPV